MKFVKCNILDDSGRVYRIKDRYFLKGTTGTRQILEEMGISENDKRVTVSYVCKGHPTVFNEDFGLIFEVKEKLKNIFVIPCDSAELNKLFHLSNRTKEEISEILETFVFSSVEKMLKKFPTSGSVSKSYHEMAWRYSGDIDFWFRHTEIIFKKDAIEIKPLAFFAEDKKKAEKMCKQLGIDIPIYDWVGDYFKEIDEW